MSTLVGVIGLISGIFQNIGIASTFFPSKLQSSTHVRIYAGMSADVDPTRSTAGNIPGVALWDKNGGFVGKVMGVYNYVIEDGKFYDHEIQGPSRDTEYLSVSAFGTDGLCVAAVGVTSPSGYQAGWVGDIGRKCGAPWYPSNLAIAGPDPELKPACVWIDQDGSNNHPHKGITVHLPSFTGEGLAEQYNDNLNTLCRSLPRFSMWKSRSVHMTLPVFATPLEFNDDGTDKNVSAVLNPLMMRSETTAPNDRTGTKLGVADGPSALEPGPIAELGPSKRRRTLGRRAQPLHDQLVISNHTAHSAKELCKSQTSAGPDFVSLCEGWFCDMAAKVLWPLCSDVVQEKCFSLKTREMKWGVKIDDLRARGEVQYENLYRRVQEWN